MRKCIVPRSVLHNWYYWVRKVHFFAIYFLLPELIAESACFRHLCSTFRSNSSQCMLSPSMIIFRTNSSQCTLSQSIPNIFNYWLREVYAFAICSPFKNLIPLKAFFRHFLLHISNYWLGKVNAFSIYDSTSELIAVNACFRRLSSIFANTDFEKWMRSPSILHFEN